ncbi:cytochrome c maturation protein CcmE [Asticcacaulis sp. YBE204]|uniref:cytochrome c maturation protein CcmE n=1 Tax=Asticcacaulis sp. YBE204 TaxID=1282363 RepID=UPI0003C4032F|nr:cytochrome c maturation protein CcmE [Asticcacaulis sp. YBE204]ESQ79561.1 cytochrome C biogenesis protein CcmE [Asticcacaulis sp. YBE204]
MTLLPKSMKARRRLMIFLFAAPVLVAGVALALFAMKDQVVYFYTPAQAYEAQVAPGRTMRLGGLVKAGSVVKGTDGEVTFVVMDQKAEMNVHFKGDLPDLFREGQGVVCEGQMSGADRFEARTVLAKHDETYMPKEVVKAIKEQGEWRPESAQKPDSKPFGEAR